jgi:hypothetical protein
MTCCTGYVSYLLELCENAGEILSSPFYLHVPFHASIAPVAAQPVMACGERMRREHRAPLTDKPSLAS